MISLIIISIVSFLGIWAWLAYEFKHPAHLSVEEETQLDEQVSFDTYNSLQEISKVG